MNNIENMNKRVILSAELAANVRQLDNLDWLDIRYSNIQNANNELIKQGSTELLKQPMSAIEIYNLKQPLRSQIDALREEVKLLKQELKQS